MVIRVPIPTRWLSSPTTLPQQPCRRTKASPLSKRRASEKCCAEFPLLRALTDPVAGRREKGCLRAPLPVETKPEPATSELQAFLLRQRLRGELQRVQCRVEVEVGFGPGKSCLGTRLGVLGPLYVDLFGALGSLSKDRHFVGQHFCEPPGDGETLRGPVVLV